MANETVDKRVTWSERAADAARIEDARALDRLARDMGLESRDAADAAQVCRTLDATIRRIGGAQ